MHYFKDFIKKALASLMLAGLVLCFGSSVKAQCPTNVPDNSGTGWTSGTPCKDINMSLDGANYCRYTVCWCYRYISSVNTFDYTISSITKDDDTCGVDVTASDIGTLGAIALHYLVVNDPAYAVYSSHIPPCCDTCTSTLERRVVLATCWEIDQPSGGNGGLAGFCTNSTAWCIKKEKVCMYNDNGDIGPFATADGTTVIQGTCACSQISCPF
jgi:hypothetical protein